jgi:hypothetical protein
VIGLDDWQAASKNPAPYVASLVEMAKKEGWTGFNLDWEGKNTTSTKALFLNFCGLMNAFADGLAKHGLVFSTDIQWVTQWSGGPSTELDSLLGAGRAKWITMDTCEFNNAASPLLLLSNTAALRADYYSTGRVMDALDFYATRIDSDHLSVGFSSVGASQNYDGLVARFEALRLYKVKDITMFMMPTSETWMPYLRKWKNDCRGCPDGGALSCWANKKCY